MAEQNQGTEPERDESRNDGRVPFSCYPDPTYLSDLFRLFLEVTPDVGDPSLLKQDFLETEEPSPPGGGGTGKGKAADPTSTWTWTIRNATNYLGFDGTLIRCKFTVWSTDGCTVDDSRGLFDLASLGIGGTWVRKNITKSIVTVPSPRCEKGMQCVHFDIDVEYEKSLRISAFRLIRIQTVTIQKWIRVCADGTATWG